MRTAAAVRERKNAHPEEYCRVPSCLWKVAGKGGTPCRKHPVRPTPEPPRPTHADGTPWTDAEIERARDRIRAMEYEADTFGYGPFSTRWD